MPKKKVQEPIEKIQEDNEVVYSGDKVQLVTEDEMEKDNWIGGHSMAGTPHERH